MAKDWSRVAVAIARKCGKRPSVLGYLVSRLILRRIMTLPNASRPTTLQTFFPRSTPRTQIAAKAIPKSSSS